MRLPQKLILPALAATAVLALSGCADRYYGSAAYNYPGTYDTMAYSNRYYAPAGYYNGYYGSATYNRGGLWAYNCQRPTGLCGHMLSGNGLSGVVVIGGMYYANLPYRNDGYGREFWLDGAWRKADLARRYG